MSNEGLGKEEIIRKCFNEKFKLKTRKEKHVKVGTKEHEYDIYQEGKVAGGITTGKSKTSRSKGKNPNSGSRDRACREILWLNLVEDVKRRVLVVTDQGMFDYLVRQFKGANFNKKIEIMLFNYENKTFIKTDNLSS